MNSARMSSMRAIELVARREIGTRLRSRSFLVITVVLVAAVMGSVLLAHYLDRTREPSTQRVGVTGQAVSYQQTLVGAARAAGLPIETVVVDGVSGPGRVRSGDLAALITGVSGGRLQVVVKSALPVGLRTEFDALARQIALNQQISALGGDPVVVQHAISTAAVQSRSLQPVDDHRAVRIGMAGVVGVLTYIMLLIGIQLTGQGVAEEKAHRIAELLLTTIRPWELLAGKVVGIGVVTVGQVALPAAAGAVTAVGVLHMPIVLLTGLLGWTLLWYLLGFVPYALVIAAAAALVSRQEDLTSVATPVDVVVVAACLVGQSIVPTHPNSVVAEVMSMIPLTSPVVMPMRAVYGVPGWQMAVAVVIALLTIGVIAGPAGRVYAHALLDNGSRVPLGTALRRTRPVPGVAAVTDTTSRPNLDEDQAEEISKSTAGLRV